MTKKVDVSLRQHIVKATEEQVVETKAYNSQRRAMKEREKKFEQITVRLPKGSREQLNNYVSNSSKYSSVNSMILELLENELGYSFANNNLND